MAILKEMKIGEIVRTYPKSVEILYQFGMGCVGCPSAQAESLEEAAHVHGLNLDELIDTLNQNI